MRLSEASPAVNSIPIAVGPGLSAPAGTTMWSGGKVAAAGAPFTVTPLTFAPPGAKSITSGCEASLRANRAVIVPVIGDF